MIFASEETREQFHALPTQMQVDFTEMEERFAASELTMHIVEVRREPDQLEIIIRIAD